MGNRTKVAAPPAEGEAVEAVEVATPAPPTEETIETLAARRSDKAMLPAFRVWHGFGGGHRMTPAAFESAWNAFLNSPMDGTGAPGLVVRRAAATQRQKREG